MKTCSRCNKNLPLSAFWKKARYKDGIYSWCKGCSREYRIEWRKNNRDKTALYYLRRRHGVEMSHKETLYKNQFGKCVFFSLCENYLPTNISQAALDHDHETGILRGLLCTFCNTRMAVVDNEEWLQAAISYRKQYLAPRDNK